MYLRICSIDGCDGAVLARDWCRRHYYRWKRNGDPLGGLPDRPRKAPVVPRTAPFEERFWSKVDKTDTCWLWLGALDSNGYGLIHQNGRARRAHRIAWVMSGRELVDGLHLDHLCRTRRCVRPDHLDQVTPAVNILRGVGTGARNAVKTHCPQGHEYTPDNTYIWPGAPGRSRQCRTCH